MYNSATGNLPPGQLIASCPGANTIYENYDEHYQNVDNKDILMANLFIYEFVLWLRLYLFDCIMYYFSMLHEFILTVYIIYKQASWQRVSYPLSVSVFMNINLEQWKVFQPLHKYIIYVTLKYSNKSV